VQFCRQFSCLNVDRPGQYCFIHGKDNIQDNRSEEKKKRGAKEMDSIKKGSGCDGLSEKKAYEPPRAMRLGEMRSGAGLCEASGSGDIECRSNGNSALGICFSSGNGE
jgi:hypothetical protein